MRLSVAPAAALLLLASACNESTNTAAPAAPGPQATSPHAASQPSGPASGPAGASPHAAFPDTPPGAPFSGLVKLGDGLSEADVKPTDVLFIMARESQGGGLAGRLMAVKRLGQVQYPLRYEIGSQDVMVPGLPFAGPFIVTARLDRDGDPMTRGEDDLYGTFPAEVKAGQEGVHLVLKKGAPKVIAAPEGVTAPPTAPGAAAPGQPSR
ncbi:MAG: hypothetical protein H6730_31270 [Deltaproteobacteria bacterium]|nr:hypothetical protein [Deltaproteobacteria bacterium]